ncbi:BCCT family transporter, partial [Endozoicomonas sp. SESOKO3]
MSDPSESRHSLNLPVFIGASSVILLIVVCTALFPDQAELYSTMLQTGIMTNASWFYVTAVAIILIGVAIVGLSRYGDIKLGPDHSEPDFSFSSWFAMLFSAGMGIGLMFFGVAEPVMHFLTPPVGDPASIESARE